MGLRQEDAADEMGLAQALFARLETTGFPPSLHERLLETFPINPAYLTDETAEPFLPDFDRSLPSDRFRNWCERNGFRPGKTVGRQVSRAEAEQLEEQYGIPRRWLMMGDGRARKQRMLSPLGSAIREARRRMGLTIGGFADALQVDPCQVVRLERRGGDAMTALAWLTQLSPRTDVDLADILAYVRAQARQGAAWEDTGRIVRDARTSADLTPVMAAWTLGISLGKLLEMERGSLTGAAAREAAARLLSRKPVVRAMTKDA